MRCTGIESNILDCPSGYSYSSRVCNHFEDAGVRCHAGGKTCMLTSLHTHILTQVLIVCTLLYHSWGKTFCVDTLVGAFYRLACVNRILKDSHTFASFSLGYSVVKIH